MTNTAEQAAFAATTPTAAAAGAEAPRHRGGVAEWKYNDNSYPYYNGYNGNNSDNNNNNTSNSSSSTSWKMGSSSDLTSEIEIIKEAQKAFTCPEGFKLSAVPPPSPNRSVIYMYGVRVDEIQTPPAATDVSTTTAGAAAAFAVGGSKAPPARKVQKPSGRYYCLASQSCREAQTYLKLPKGGTSSATDNLGNLHGPMFKVKSTHDAAEPM